jgi:hypothetical protein
MTQAGAPTDIDALESPVLRSKERIDPTRRTS